MAEILEPSSRKRKLAAILHADVVGFSRLMGEDEAGTHRALGELRARRRPADRGAWRTDRRHGRRQLAGGFFERRRCAELRRRDAARVARDQRPDPARAPARIADRRQSRRRDRRRRRHLRRRRQHRRPARGARPARHRLHFADRLRPGQEQARSRLPPARQPSRQEYRRAGARLRGRRTRPRHLGRGEGGDLSLPPQGPLRSSWPALLPGRFTRAQAESYWGSAPHPSRSMSRASPRRLVSRDARR